MSAASDQLSEVFDLVEVRGMISGGFAADGRWVSWSQSDEPIELLAMANGRARLTTNGISSPIELEAGDVALLNNRSWVELAGGTGNGPLRKIPAPVSGPYIPFDGAGSGDVDIVIGTKVALNSAGHALLQEALPPVGHIRAAAATATNLRCSIDRLFEEATGQRIGSAFAIRQHGQLLLLDALRAYVDQTDLPAGWLRVLTDDRLRPALTLMHSNPQERWSLEGLARVAAMSRTSFAERFRTMAGIPPLAYLSRWRMLLAQRALRDSDVRVGTLAVDLGYASESAFSSAFKRELGESPLHYRSRLRTELSTGAEELPA